MILVSIGSEVFREQIHFFLTGVGFSVWQDNWSTEAPALCNSEIDLLLTDAPIRDVVPLVQCALSGGGPPLRVLVISAEPDYVCHALVPNPSIDFIEKPFAWQDLERKINTMFDNRGLRNQQLRAAAVGA
jgi:hypothetical protein